MQSIGNYLKSGREAKNIRLSEVAQSTKISKWYLDCLEKDEFDKIPGGPYIKGYITSYASFIGIEEDEILKRYDSLQINNDDENETQDQLTIDKKRQKLIGFSFTGKKLAILSMVALFLLCLGIYYFFFQKQTHLVAQLPDVQYSKKQSDPSSKTKQEAAGASHPSDLSKDTHLNPPKTGSEFNPAFRDPAGKESQAILPSDSEFEGTSKASPMKKDEVRINDTTGKEAMTHHEPHSAQNVTLKQISPPESNNTSHQSSTQSADVIPGSAPMYQAPDAQSQITNDLKVIKAVATSDVVNRNPEEPGGSFPWSTEKVYIWSMIECERPPSSIRHTYYFEGEKVNDIVLEIKSPQWRTWSYKTLMDNRWIGQWKVDITSIDGELLKRIFFEVN